MFNKLALKKNQKVKNEQGFTLVEMMIVVLIIGILTSTGLLVAGDQQRQAIIATVKHDVASNKSIMSPGNAGKAYVKPAVFEPDAAATDQNVTKYVVSPKQDEACTDTTRTFSPGDVVVYRFLSTVGKIEPLACPDLLGDETIVITPPAGGGGAVTPPGGGGEVQPSPSPTETGQPNNGDDGKSTDPISPGNDDTIIDVKISSNETYRVCYVITVTSKNNTGAVWAVKVRKDIAPFLNNFIEGDGGDSRFVRKDLGDHYLLSGTGDKALASVSRPIVYGGGGSSFCTKAPNNRAVIPEYTKSDIAAINSPSGGAWYGTQNFSVKNSSQYHTGWSVEVDLTDLRKVVNARPNDVPRVDNDVAIDVVHLGGNIYKISSNVSYRSVKEGSPYTFTVRIG